jgi:hypothetical protein
MLISNTFIEKFSKMPFGAVARLLDPSREIFFPFEPLEKIQDFLFLLKTHMK